MTPYTSKIGTTIAINAKLLVAFGLAWLGWAMWPTDVNWWGLGFISIVLGLSSLTLIIDALRLMLRVYQFEKAINDYVAQGGSPKSSEMASGDDLKKAGMR